MSEVKKECRLQEWHLLLKTGFEFVITCEKAEITKNGFGVITNIHWIGIKDNVPIKIDLEECIAIWYRFVEREVSA